MTKIHDNPRSAKGAFEPGHSADGDPTAWCCIPSVSPSGWIARFEITSLTLTFD